MLAAGVLAASFRIAHAVDLGREVEFNIPAQQLSAALIEFSHQAKIQVVISEDLGQRTTQGIAGKYTIDQALGQLLKATGLGYHVASDTSITISRPASTAPGVSGGRSGSSQNENRDQFREAQGAPVNPTSSSTIEAGQNPVKLEKVIVTAQKREERLIDVPTSIVAVGAEELQERQIITLEDLPAAVPGFSYSKTGNNVFFEIRGVSSTSGTGSLVGMYIDEADVTLGGAGGTQTNPVTYDLERVEVLRGPQGTLYGEGSAGGTIRFITRSPKLNRLSFDSQVAALFTQDGRPSERINAMVNVPLVENQLGLRIAGTYQHDGGWIDLTGTDRRNINTQDLANVRVKGLWQPNTKLTVSAMAVINRNARSMGYSDTNSPTEWTQSFNLPVRPRLRNDYDLYNLTLTYDLSSAVRILNTTTYLRVAAPVWGNGFSAQLFPPGPGGLPPLEAYVPFQQVFEHLWTDELRLISTGSGRWQWTTGGFFRHYRDLLDPFDYYAGFPIPPGAPLPAPPAMGGGSDTLYKSWSAFADASYQLSNRFTLGAGIRYFRDDQDFSNLLTRTQQTGRFHSLDPRGYAQFKLFQDANVYASVAKGFRSGGFNTLGLPKYGPESVLTYELGTKMALLEGRIGLDAAVFCSNYTDYQTNGLTSSDSLLNYYSNAGRARIKGVEWSLTWRPLPQYRLDVRGDHLDTKFLQVNTVPNPLTGSPSSAFVVGDPLDNVPRYQVTTSGQRDFVWLGKQGFIRLDYSQEGSETVRNRSIGPWYYGKSDVIQLLNLRASLRLNEKLGIGFSAQNLLNDQGFVNPLYIGRNGVRSRPRTLGVDFNATFD